MKAINYFVCTLGQAVLLDDSHRSNYKSINDFLAQQISRVPDLPAVGFYQPSSDQTKQWNYNVLSFKDVHNGSQVFAALIRKEFNIPARQTVALLCPSSAEFLFVWLGLMRLGHPVLLVAPQCSPNAIVHLCKSCEVSVLLYDCQFADLAINARKESSKEKICQLQVKPIPAAEDGTIFDMVKQAILEDHESPTVDENEVAYLHHTSGTSTGAPKPIPQTHRAGLGVLPKLDGKAEATFTTTPLYHGGIADLFRSWASDAMIWLFPSREVPVTAANIVQCLELSLKSFDKDSTPSVKYFSSVPYVLQIMAADTRGMELLQRMDIVGVGGAALPTEIGNKLVSEGVNLISRFGSAECGFLMSSHRDYDHDKEWQFLRPSDDGQTLKFEKREDGLSELVILPGWPHMAKTNREDGSYATADLFASHHHISNAWRYHSRADSQLTLVTGKKFDPAPVESAIAATSLLNDVLVFGNGRPYPGALIFRSLQAKHMSDTELVKILTSTFEKLNTNSQAHVRIPRNMIVPMPYDEQALEKSSKGTILRRKAEERFADVIEQAYAHVQLPGNLDVPDNELAPVLINLVLSITGKGGDLKSDTDLFSHGVDSVACVQIRHAISQLLPQSSDLLPLTIVEDCGTVENLSRFIIARRHGATLSDEEDQEKLMLNLVNEYSRFENVKYSTLTNMYDNQPGAVVLLTGVTGALGSHILNVYRSSPKVSKIYCLVRGADQIAVEERVNKALMMRMFATLDQGSLTPNQPPVIVLKCKLSDRKLGLSPDMYQKLASEVTIIQHIAWAVNFRISLQSFVHDHIAGLRNLIDFAISGPRSEPPIFLFCSSVASVRIWTISDEIPENLSQDPKTAGPLGYSQSKWIAEQICSRAHEHTSLKNKIAIMRVGQLSGDAKHGIWNMSEAYPLMLSTTRIVHALPDLKNEPLTWLPVDVAAQAFVQIADSMKRNGVTDSLGVYHILNDNRDVQWSDLLGWLKKREDFDIIDSKSWVEKLEELESMGSNHSALKLLGHWKGAFGNEDRMEMDPSESMTARYAMQKTHKVAPILQSVQNVDEQYFERIWNWISHNSC